MPLRIRSVHSHIGPQSPVECPWCAHSQAAVASGLVVINILIPPNRGDGAPRILPAGHLARTASACGTGYSAGRPVDQDARARSATRADGRRHHTLGIPSRSSVSDRGTLARAAWARVRRIWDCRRPRPSAQTFLSCVSSQLQGRWWMLAQPDKQPDQHQWQRDKDQQDKEQICPPAERPARGCDHGSEDGRGTLVGRIRTERHQSRRLFCTRIGNHSFSVPRLRPSQRCGGFLQPTLSSRLDLERIAVNHVGRRCGDDLGDLAAALAELVQHGLVDLGADDRAHGFFVLLGLEEGLQAR